jgi:TonB-linked SusC/RagA family outer membrane protein
MLGYVRQEIQINNRSVVDVTLQEEEQEMTEVVVVGYGTIVKKDLTSAVTSLKGKDLVAGSVNPIMAIQGKVAGLSVQSSNGTDPNAGVSLQLRGVNSVNAGMGPLVVIDGVPGGDINSVAKEDVESINILKDGSAASIYGTRASGGVILITTKQAKAGNTNVNLTSEFFSESVRRKPNTLSREEFLSIPENSDQDKGGNTNWYDEILNTNPFSQRYALNINGGSEKALIYTTFTLRDANGMAIQSNRKEYSGRINSIFKFLNDRAQLTTNLSYNQVDATYSSNGMFNMALLLNPTEKLYDPTDVTGYNVIQGGFDAFNPVAEVMLQKDKNQIKYLLASSTLKINITSDLSTSGMIGIKNNSDNPTFFRSAQHRISRSGGPDGYASQGFGRNIDKTYEWTFNYYKLIENHSINAVAGYSYQDFNGQGFNANNSDFSLDGTQEYDLGNGTYLSDGRAGMGSWRNPTVKLAAFFGRVNYAYDNKYIVTASLRREGSSKFAPGKRWGTFPGISAAWRISEESFLKDHSFINDLKLRAGYGETGNADFDAITAYRVYQSDTWWLYNGDWIRTFGVRHNQNADLKWEIKKETNVGLDFTLLNNRLSGRVNYYKRKIQDMIYSVDVSQPPAIYNQTLVNIGNMENRGFEVELNYDVVKNEDWTYTTGIVAGTNKGKLVTLNGSNTYADRMGFGGPGNPGTAVRLLPGHDLGNYFIWRSAGFTEDGKWLVYNKDNEVIPATEKTIEDKAFVGNAIPKLTLSWNNSVSYKNFDATIYMRSWLGHDVFNMIDMYYGLNTVRGQN